MSILGLVSIGRTNPEPSPATSQFLSKLEPVRDAVLDQRIFTSPLVTAEAESVVSREKLLDAHFDHLHGVPSPRTGAKA